MKKYAILMNLVKIQEPWISGFSNIWVIGDGNMSQKRWERGNKPLETWIILTKKSWDNTLLLISLICSQSVTWLGI